jgi:putative endonuclease
MPNRRQTGQKWERWVGEELQKRGYQVLLYNYPSPYGEIDLIAIHQNTLVFIEVKARQSLLYGQPYEAVTQKKIDRIARTGHHFRQAVAKKGPTLPPASRIDVASLLVTKSGEVKEFKLLENYSG